MPNSPYPNLPYAPMEYEENLGTYYYGPAYSPNNPGARPPSPMLPEGGGYGEFRSTPARIFGGTLYHWLGTALRYLPSTFREKTLFGHSADWPISYQTLEPWYCEAEKEIGVCPIQAKYDATVHLKRAFNPKLDPDYAKYSGTARPVEYRKGAVVTKVGIDANGRVSEVHWKDGPTGKGQPPVRAKLYVLAAHGREALRARRPRD